MVLNLTERDLDSAWREMLKTTLISANNSNNWQLTT